MAVTSVDILEPEGRVSLALFPDLDPVELNERVDRLIARAEGIPAVGAIADAERQDQAVTAYVEWRLFDQAFQRLIAEPANLAVDDGATSSYLGSQITEVRRLRDDASAVFARLSQGTAPAINPTGGAVRTTFTW